MLDYFHYNGYDSYEFGLITTGLKTYGAPNRRVETVHVRGRNGDLLIDEGCFDNIIVSYDVAVIKDFPVNARDIAQWLLSSSGYHELSDSYNPEYSRQATYFNALDFDVEALRKQGKATISFYARPERYAVVLPSTKTGNGTITLTNPYGFTAKPLIKVTGAETITVDSVLTIKINQVVNNQVYIDCETMQCYSGTTNCNQYVEVTDFPVIPPYATVNFVITGRGTGKVTTINPRWWRL